MKVLLLLVGASCALCACSNQDNKTHPMSQSSQSVDDSTLSKHVEDVTIDSTQDSSSIPSLPFPMPPIPPKIIGCFWSVDEEDEQYDDFEREMDYGHSQSNELDSSIEYYTDLVAAKFPGGNDLLPMYLRKHLNYPPELKERGIEGSVYVRFTVSLTGKIKDVRIQRGLVPIADSICAKVFRQMPTWTPAKWNGKVERTSYLLPIKFMLNNKTASKVDSTWSLRPILPSYYSLTPDSTGQKGRKKAKKYETNAVGQLTLDLYPNPAKDYCHISVNVYSSDMQYSIFTLSGQMQVQENLTSDNQKIDLTNLTSGNYLIVVTSKTGDTKASRQFSVQ